MLKPSVLASYIDQPEHILSFMVESNYICLLIENELQALEANSGSSALEWESRPFREGVPGAAWVIKTRDDQTLSTVIGFLLNLELQPILSSGSDRKSCAGTFPGSDANEGGETHRRTDRRPIESSEKWLSAAESVNPITPQRIDSPQEFLITERHQQQKEESTKLARQYRPPAEPRLPGIGLNFQSIQPVKLDCNKNNLGRPVSSLSLIALRSAMPVLCPFREMKELIDRNHGSRNVRLNQLRNCNTTAPLFPGSKYQEKERMEESASDADESAQKPPSRAPSVPQEPPVSNLKAGNSPRGDIQISSKIFSRVVYIKGIDSSKMSLRQLSNLMECFGDVEIGMYHAKKEYALLKFTDQTGAKTAIKELYGKEICGKSLLLHSSELEEIVTKYFTNGKYYHVPNYELKRFQPIKKPHHICRFVFLTICFTDENESSRILGLTDLKRLFGSALLSAKTRLCNQANEFVLEFHNTKAAIEFIMNHNYSEFPEECLFAVLTFALKNKWQ